MSASDFKKVLDASRQTPIQNTHKPRVFSDLMDATQCYVLFNVAHHGQSPKCDKACIRILGLFNSPGEASQHAKSLGVSDCNMYLSETGKKILLCKNAERQLSSDYTMSKIDDITRRYLLTRDLLTQEYKQNVQTRKMGQTGLSVLPKVESTPLTPPENPVSVREIGITGSIRNQLYAVISVLLDNTAHLSDDKVQEPIVIVWRSFQTETDAQDYIATRGSIHVRDMNLYIVEMYNWLSPGDADKSDIPSKYRDSQLDALMQYGMHGGKQDIALFEQWCSQNQIETPVTDLGNYSGDSIRPNETTGTSMDATDADGTNLEVRK